MLCSFQYAAQHTHSLNSPFLSSHHAHGQIYLSLCTILSLVWTEATSQGGKSSTSGMESSGLGGSCSEMPCLIANLCHTPQAMIKWHTFSDRYCSVPPRWTAINLLTGLLSAQLGLFSVHGPGYIAGPAVSSGWWKGSLATASVDNPDCLQMRCFNKPSSAQQKHFKIML